MRGSGSFRSDFGGLWTDRSDADEVLASLIKQGMSADLADRVKFWMKHGYVILERAVDVALCEKLRLELHDVYKFGNENFLIQDPTAAPGTGSPVVPNIEADRMRIVDMYGRSNNALNVLLAPQIKEFLSTVFSADPLLFQGLTFEKGSGQGLHQDTAYVVLNKPMELAAAWIALEDISPESGELMYLDGSHKMPDWKFGGNSKHYDPDQHDALEHDEWSKNLIRKGEELGFEKKIFRPNQGDVLIWSADLVHGGSPVGDKNLTRRSIVGHYCPVDVNPHYFSYMEGRKKFQFEGAFVSSAYYDEIVAPQPFQKPGRTKKIAQFFKKK
jgi:ectoine hydroxylase-related dioxygenase (phytanoyl-CoA dioxygenase family)